MAKVPAFAKTFAGRWLIVEMDTWDTDFLDLVEKAHTRLGDPRHRWPSRRPLLYPQR